MTDGEQAKSLNAGIKVKRAENTEQMEAFELYYAMPRERRYVRALSIMLHRHEQTLYRWSKAFGWMERVRQRDLEVLEKMRARRETDKEAIKDTLRNYWKGLLQKTIVKDAEGKTEIAITPKDVADAERITKMILLLQGEPTERIDYITHVIDRVIVVLDEELTDPDLKFKIFERLSGLTAIQTTTEEIKP